MEALNPILLRELAEATRHRNFLLFVTGFSIVLLLAVAISWPAPDERYSGRYTWRSGEVLFATFFSFAAFMLALLVPSFSFDAITGERDRGTLDLLVISPISSREIVEGKTHATVVLGVLFLVITAPFLFMVYLLGGTPLYVVLFSYGGLILMTLLLASLGTLTSALASRTWQSAVATFIIVFGILFLTAAVIDGSRGPRGDDAFATFWRLIIGEPDTYPFGLVRLFLVTIAVAAVRHFVVVVDTPSAGSRMRLLVPLLLFFLIVYSIFIWGMFTNISGEGFFGLLFFMFSLMSLMAVLWRLFLDTSGQSDLMYDVGFIILFGLLLVTVALDIDEKPFQYIGGSGAISTAIELVILSLREMWLVIILLSTLFGLALLWLPVLASIAVLGTIELLGFTPWLTKALGTPGDIGVVIPLGIAVVACSLGLYDIMTELGSRRLLTSVRQVRREVPEDAPVVSAAEGETP